MVSNPGWQVYRCWQGNNTCFCELYFQEDVHEDMLHALLLPTTSQLQSLWMVRYQENWIGHSVSAYARTDQSPWLDGYSGQRRRELQNESLMHCVIHREMLTSQKMSPELNILQDVIKIVNHLKVYALNSCLFMQLWGHGCTHLLLYTEVRWCSRGQSF